MSVNSKRPSRTELNFYFETPVLLKSRDLIAVNSVFYLFPFSLVTFSVTVLGKGLWSLSSTGVSTC